MKLNPFKLERFFALHEFSAPYLLGCSDCESFTISELFRFVGAEQEHEKFLSLHLGYTETLGSPELRQEISSLYDKISSDQILVHAGAGEAIFNFMNSSLQAGDHIIVHSPYYQALGETALSIGASVTEWNSNGSEDWELDLTLLKGSLRKNTKVVVINVPHNPTGYLPKEDFLYELSELSEKHGFIVFSDEVYRGLEYQLTDRLPSFADINERAVSLGVMSKSYGLPGLRIGWVSTQNSKIYEAMATFKDYTTLCNSAPSEYLATVALRQSESIINRNLEIIRTNLELLQSFFFKHSNVFEWKAPKAAPIAFPRLLQGCPLEFCEELVESKGVLLIPGTLFGDQYQNVRIGFGRRNLKDSLEQLDVFLDERA